MRIITRVATLIICLVLVCTGFSVMTPVNAMDTLDVGTYLYQPGDEPTDTLHGVCWHPTGDYAIAVGDSGKVWKFDATAATGSQWSLIGSTPEGALLYAIEWEPNDNLFYMFGSCGANGNYCENGENTDVDTRCFCSGLGLFEKRYETYQRGKNKKE